MICSPKRTAGRRLLSSGSLRLEPLFLPWLCPVHIRSHTRQLHHSPALKDTQFRKGPRALRKARHNGNAQGIFRKSHVTSTKSRSLATAASVAEVPLYTDNFEPSSGREPTFMKDTFPLEAYRRTLPNLSEIRTSDPSKPIMLTDSVASRPRHFRRRDGIGGDISEIIATLDVCLKVGKYERGATILRRLTQIYDSGSEELEKIQTFYLETLVTEAIETKNESLLQKAQTWFEMALKQNELVPQPTMWALIIKGCLEILQADKLQSSIQRYMRMAAKRDQTFLIFAVPTLSANQISKVVEMCDIDPSEVAILSRPSLPEIENSIEQKSDFVQPTEVKSLGLSAVKKSLSMFDRSRTLLPEGTDDDLSRLVAETFKRNPYLRQEKLEREAVDAAMERWREEFEELKKIDGTTSLQTRQLGALMWDWQLALTPLIKAELQKLEAIESKKMSQKCSADEEICAYYPFLRLLSPEKTAAVTIIHTMQYLTMPSHPNKAVSLVTSLGRSLQDEAIASAITRDEKHERNNDTPYAAHVRRTAKALAERRFLNPRVAHTLRQDIRNSVHLDRFSASPWSEVIKAKVGALCLTLLLQCAKMEVSTVIPETRELYTEIQPAFLHSHLYQNGKRFGSINMNAKLEEIVRREPVASTITKFLPMIVPPKPWRDFARGGFLKTPVPVVRLKDGQLDQRQYTRAAVLNGDMYQIFNALDALGQVPWRINKDVFEVMREVWNTGEELADIPPAEPKLEYPPEPEAAAEISERRKWTYAVREIENLKSGLHSQRCFLNYQLEIARAYLNETFYFPHNVDFRGRAYPISPYLNHMGADNARGLLMFAEEKELGVEGLDWLKVQIASVYGYDKASLQERREFTMKHVDDIYDSADNPLTGRRWWLGAEDPWQCLAACFELKRALEAPEPTKYKSALPVHQDGSCNGLQHYAALGGDSAGAKQVNLEPGDRPADVYSSVADLVRQSVAKDAENGVAHALKLKDKINRKVVKQTVMTNVYGVTYLGASRQIFRQLDDLMPDEPSFNNRSLASYVATKVFEALSSMFQGARLIQFWLGECAKRICTSMTADQMDWIIADAEKSGTKQSMQSGQSKKEKGLGVDKLDDVSQFRSSVTWTTPLRMPIVQPYRFSKFNSIETSLQRVYLAPVKQADPVDKRKQLQAFPPNFIHSLDATHMHLSALKCHEVGITFAAVHDSFWTHAGDVSVLSRILRDAFVRLHSDDIIGRLKVEFEARYNDSMYQLPISLDHSVGRKIEKWRLKYKRQLRGGEGSEKNKKLVQHPFKELMLERQRVKLLRSEDEAERVRGKEMVTPVSILEDAATKQGKTLNDLYQDLAPRKKPVAAKLQKTRKLETLAKVSHDGDITGIESDMLTIGQEDDQNVDTEGIAKTESAEASANSSEPTLKKRVSSIWVPLVFPPVPAKGNFDVSRLRASQYFFS